jgi:phage regulator Rha-like protein
MAKEKLSGGKKEGLVTRPEEVIINKIFLIRGEKVMLDSDLAELFGVETKRLKEQVKRNIERFPEKFLFELTKDETQNLRSQIATSSWGGSRYASYAFTEHGVLMLANVLRSESAIKMSIRIIEIFVQMRQVMLTNKDILLKLEQLENKVGKHSKEIEVIFEYLKELVSPTVEPREKIGFKIKEEKPLRTQNATIKKQKR